MIRNNVRFTKCRAYYKPLTDFVEIQCGISEIRGIYLSTS